MATCQSIGFIQHAKLLIYFDNVSDHVGDKMDWFYAIARICPELVNLPVEPFSRHRDCNGCL